MCNLIDLLVELRLGQPRPEKLEGWVNRLNARLALESISRVDADFFATGTPWTVDRPIDLVAFVKPSWLLGKHILAAVFNLAYACYRVNKHL